MCSGVGAWGACCIAFFWLLLKLLLGLKDGEFLVSLREAVQVAALSLGLAAHALSADCAVDTAGGGEA